MKTMMIILDGLANEPIKDLGYKTSYDYANHENLDRLAAQGIKGYFNACPQGYLPESMNCILNLLGIPRESFPKSRAALELLAHGHALSEDEVVLRCNLVAVEDKKLISFNGGGLTKQEMKKVSEQAAGRTGDIDFIHLSGYRNLLVMNKKDFDSLDCLTYPPHEFLGEDIESLLGEVCKLSEVLHDFVSSNEFIIDGEEGKQYRYVFYPWGIAEKSKLPTFKQKYGISGAAVCGAEIAKGIALALGLYVPEIEGLTADIDTNLLLKAESACSLLEEYDFVFVHINGLDEASHRYDVNEKIRFIEKIDRQFIAYVANNLDSETSFFICADHATSPLTGKHTVLDVPYIIRSQSLQNRTGIDFIPTGGILKYLLSIR